MGDADFTPLALDVAMAFWGDPEKALSTAKEKRWGSQGSRSLNIEKGAWFDYEADVGGGVIDLVMHEKQCSKAEAVTWLEGEEYIDKRPRQAAPQSRPEQNRPAAQRKQGKWTIVATYDYRSGDGELLYQVARIQWQLPDGSWVPAKNGKPDKTFLQRRPSGLSDGSWVWGLSAGEYMRRHAGDDFRQFDEDVWKSWGSGQKHVIQTDVAHGLYRLQDVERAIEVGRTIFVVEGEKAVEAAVKLGVEATCNSGGAKKFHADLLRHFRGANVVILPDNDPQSVKKVKRKWIDDAGVERVDEEDVPMFHPDGRPVLPGPDHAEMVAGRLRGIAASVKVLALPGLPLKGDIVEWIAAGGTAPGLLALADDVPTWKPRPPRSKFGALGLNELHLPHLRHEFLIDGFLDRRGVAMMPGASGSGKTFLVLEAGMCVAMNRPFWGMEVKSGLVVYQAGEGKEGVTKRIDGWLMDRGIEPSAEIPFKVLTRKVNLFLDDKDTDELIEECRSWMDYFRLPMRMLTIDTLNKAITGANENAGQDMSKVIARLERLSETLDCAVVVPMHKGKNGEQRGHTSLTGDVANVINVTKLGSKESPLRDKNGRPIHTVALDKNKDGDDGRPMRFVLRPVVVGTNEQGKPVTTCVVDRPDGDENALVQDGKLSPNQTLFLNILRDAIDIEGTAPPDGVLVPAGKNVVAYKDFAARLWNKWPFTAPEHETAKRNAEFQRAVGDIGKRLTAYGYIDRDNRTGTIWWTGKSDKPKRKLAEPPPPLPQDVREALNDGVMF